MEVSLHFMCFVVMFGMVKCQCKFISNSDSNDKKRALLEPFVGKRYKVSVDDNVYHIGICTDALVGQPVGESSSAIKLSKADPSKRIVLGDFTNSKFMSEVNWIYLEYFNDQAHNTNCYHETTRVVILFICNQRVTDNTAVLRALKVDDPSTEGCYYLFQMDHSDACHVKVTDKHDINVGLMIFLVVLIVFSLYLIIGFFYKHFVLGATGADQLPNYHFWKQIGSFLWERLSRLCPSKQMNRSQSYHGVGDDLLMESEPRDDDPLNF